MAVGARLLDLFDRLQSGGKVVLLTVDDLQWADRPSARAVLFALRRLRADKMLAVVSTRAGGLADPGWARFVSGDSRVTRIRLGGLSPGDLIELASALGLGVLSQRGASRLAAHTEGNALYCRALLEEIGVARLNAAQARGLPAPRELSAVILARVAALPTAAQSLLVAASVLGQHAPVSAIASVARLPDARNEVDAAVAAGLLTEGGSTLELAFAHPLYRAAIYADLSPASRRELHARAGEVVVGSARPSRAPRGPAQDWLTAVSPSGLPDLARAPPWSVPRQTAGRRRSFPRSRRQPRCPAADCQRSRGPRRRRRPRQAG